MRAGLNRPRRSNRTMDNRPWTRRASQLYLCHRTLGKFVILLGRLLRHCRIPRKELQTLGSRTSTVFQEGTLNLRASERTAVDIEITEGPDHERASARALIYDLSQDGCMIEFVGRRLSPGDRVAVPLDDRTLVPATLVWQVGRNAGLQFVERLDKTMIDRLAPKQAAPGAAVIRRSRLRSRRRLGPLLDVRSP